MKAVTRYAGWKNGLKKQFYVMRRGVIDVSGLFLASCDESPIEKVHNPGSFRSIHAHVFQYTKEHSPSHSPLNKPRAVHPSTSSFLCALTTQQQRFFR